jgi:SAM-dependent methyltransferase
MVNKELFDRKLLRKNLTRFSNYNQEHDIINKRVCNKIIDDLEYLKQFPVNILEMNYTNDLIFNYLNNQYQINNYVKGNKELIFDDEFIPFKPNKFDLIISNLAMQFINDVPNFLKRIHNSLMTDGSVFISFFGEDNLSELSNSIYYCENLLYNHITPRMIPTIDIKTAGQLMIKSGFRNIVVDQDQFIINYQNTREFLINIKKMGLGNILVDKTRKFFTKKLYHQLIKFYQDNYKNSDGEIYATYKILTIYAQK